MKGFVFDHHVFVNNVCCHYNITETVAAVAVKLTERIEGQWLWDLATQLTRWQPPSVGHGARFPVPALFDFESYTTHLLIDSTKTP